MRRTTTSAAGIFALCLIWACEDAALFQPKPLESMAAAAPICFGQAATIWPQSLGAGTGQHNALGGWTITGTPGVDVISGSAGADSIFGLGGDDVICGRTGDDILVGGAGADMLFGNGDFDVADYSTSPGGVRIGLRGRGTRNDAAGDILTLVEGIIGTPFPDILTGDELPNVLIGLAGRDRIDGGGGADILDGGADLDELNFAKATEAVTADLMTNTGRRGWALGDTYLSFETLTGSAYGDTLIGNNGPNRMTGNDGSDIMYGMGGNDRMIGGIGNDKLYGGAGTDILDGSTGTNTLDGGDGDDSGTANCGDLVSTLETFVREACPASFRTTEIVADSVLIRADNVGSTLITVQLKDEDGTVLPEGGFVVELFTNVGTLTDGTSTATSLEAVDNLDGTYELRLVAGNTASMATVRGIINGDTIADSALVIVSAGRSITWTGDENTAWENKNNWSPSVRPNPADSATIPAGRPNYPVLSANEGITNLLMSEITTVNVGPFDLNITGHAQSVQSGGIIGTSGRVLVHGTSMNISGRFPSLRVFGRYSLTANVTVVGGRLVVQGGRLRDERFRVRVTPN